MWDWAAHGLSAGLWKFSRSSTTWDTIHSEDRPGRKHLSWALDLPWVLYLNCEDVLGQDDMGRKGWAGKESLLLRPDLLSLMGKGGNFRIYS